MVNRLGSRHSLLRVHRQQPRDKILRVLALVRPGVLVKAEHAMRDIVVHPLVIALRKRVIAAQSTPQASLPALQDVGDDAERPHVHRRTVRLVGQHFRSHVAGRAAVGLQSIGDRDLVRQTKIGNPDRVQVIRLGQQQVLGLQIAMDDPSLMAIVQRVQQSHHAALRLRLAEGMGVDDRVEELAAQH